MKIKIFTECSKSIGLGHISRCTALYDEIHYRGFDVELIIEGEIGGIEFLKNKIITNEDWLDVKYLFEKITDEDYVIVDSYKANREHYEIITLKSKKALYIDDNGRLIYPNAIIVNPALDVQNVDYSYMPKNFVLSGSKYVILRSVFTNVKREIIRDTVNNVLVVMGGTDVRNITSVILKICKSFLDINFNIVLNNCDIKKYKDEYKLENIKYHENLSESEMSRLMLCSDLAISAAGQTIYELIATQTPFIAIQVAENQKNNVNSLVKNIPHIKVFQYNEDNFFKKLQYTLMEMKNCDLRKMFVEEMKNIIDGNGSKRIIDALLNDKELNNEIYLRKAKIEDINYAFDLSNKDYVRKYSINKNKILWNDHVKWFKSAIQGKDIILYIVTDSINLFLGQIRYKIDKGNATISISLTDIIRGKGLSKTILHLSIDELFKEEKNVNEIIAYVSEDNVASLKMFESLNFNKISKDISIIKLTLRRVDYFDN